MIEEDKIGVKDTSDFSLVFFTLIVTERKFLKPNVRILNNYRMGTKIFNNGIENPIIKRTVKITVPDWEDEKLIIKIYRKKILIIRENGKKCTIKVQTGNLSIGKKIKNW